jgi:hypothetical protein
VRYSIHAVYNNYTYPNVENKLDQIFFRHGISFYMNWHWDRLDLSSHLDLISQVDQYTYLQTMLGMTLVYRITDELSVQFSPTLGYRRAVINAPNPSNSQASALEQFVAGQNYSNWTFMSMFGLNYVFGNVRLNQQDQRWLKH